MANRYGTPILFAMEKNVTLLSARISFGANGVPTLDSANSKGFCNVSLGSISFTGTTANASPTVSSVSSFAGLYKGMTVQDSGPTNVNSTISSMNAGGGTITLAGNATGTNTGLTASGGRYVLQLGTQAGVRLDTYYKMLFMDFCWDVSSAAAQGGASTLALAPANLVPFVVGNNVNVRTIPGTAASAATDASITIQMGTSSGSNFTAGVPASGEVLRIYLALCNSSAL